ncbi:aspartate aminotransferase family protein [Nitriliruptor alkaliphilus]|uniref:aspartate aminotransferase family protein n=1 Tax=Nitriliruptor alkaliphilus TaxID=427918 RepID=UPI0006967422|nr:aminotransferase class III-fold pyridoxal phosphate-dependent enzyme [Nitriliruptor alkaliphilus]
MERNMDQHLADVWFKVTDLQVVSASAATITTNDGTDYLDLTSGIGVVNTGHCHPKVVEAVREQAGRFLHAQVNCYQHDQLEPLATRLAEVTPDGIERFFYANSGAEATEAAVKLAKQATGKPNIIVFQGSFHGRSHLTMAMTTSKAVYRAGYAPLPSGVLVAPFPYTFLTGEDEATAVARCLAAFDLLLTTQTSPAEVAAVVIEPVLGEGGYVPAPRAFLEGLLERCRANGILFVADEVQSGFGRTGELFAIDHAELQPDVLVMAKGIASGFPMSAIGASAELMSRWPVGSHGGTYGGNPMGCAAALATIDVLTGPGFLDHARERGDQFLAGLQERRGRHRAIGENRGLGLMLATEVVDDHGRPDPARTAAILQHLLHEERVVAMSCGPFGSTLRWIPPLVVTRDEVDRALSALDRALEATAG